MKLLRGDCLEKLKTLTNNSVDSLITDPPAGISFMGKDWDGDKGDRDTWILWLRTIMKEAHRVMKPGAHGLVWAIPRTSHWTATALEDAGFEIRDVVTHLFGSGFPKSLNVGLAIDKLSGTPNRGKAILNIKGAMTERDDRDYDLKGVPYEPTTPEAKQWSGWGTALKPASEHWILVRKPCSEKTVAKNVLKWGVGGINIDGCRVGTETLKNKTMKSGTGETYGKYPAWDGSYNEVIGRFPANLVLDEVAAEMLDEQSGDLKKNGSGNIKISSGGQNRKVSQSLHTGGGMNVEGKENTGIRDFGDSGGASRFFYVAKASKKDRGEGNTHPTVKAQKLMEYLITLITPPNGIVLDPFAGSASTGVAAIRLGFEFIGIEKEAEYYEIGKKRLAHARTEKRKAEREAV